MQIPVLPNADGNFSPRISIKARHRSMRYDREFRLAPEKRRHSARLDPTQITIRGDGALTEERLAALQRGHLGKSLFAVLWTNNPAVTREQHREMLPDHLEFLHDLEERGVLFASGPLRVNEGSPQTLHGMAILRAPSLVDAEKIIADEPFTKNGYRTAQIFSWTLNEGSFSVRLRFGAGSYDVL